MGFRITTGMMLNTYRYNLQNSTQKRSDSSDKVLTQRNFNSYAEDPASATQAFRLRREFYQTTSQIANTKDVYSKFNTAWQNVQGMLDDLVNPMEKMAAIRANNGATGEARRALAQVLRETSESMIQGFNQQLGDHFIFAGNDGLNVPFEWKGEDLYYRGINVNSGNVKKPTAAESDWLKNWRGYIDSTLANFDTTDPVKVAQKEELERAQAWSKYFLRETDTPPGPLTDGEAYLNALAQGDTTTPNKQDWIDYYKHVTDVKPSGTEPDWVKDWDKSIDAALENFDVNDPAKVAQKEELERAQAWSMYFNHETDTMPGDASVGEAYLTDFENKAAANGMSPTELEGWKKYYMHEVKEPPQADEPAWVTSGNPPADKYGVPTDMPGFSNDEVERGWINYYKDQGNLAKLKEMCGEEMYIDLGMGAAENSPNNPVRGSYFNSALSGLDYTGFGIDETDEFGDPKNMAVLMRQLADVLDTWDEDTQGYNPALAKNSAKGLTSDELEAKAFRLMDKLKLAQEDLTAKHVELNAQSSFLQTNQQRLELQSTAQNMEILDIEQVDLADAITGFSWDMYCYNAALKIGNQLLSQSLIDYMN